MCGDFGYFKSVNMKKQIYSVLLLMIPVFSFAQQIITYPVNELDSQIHETSGLINIDGRFITHNDSGNQPALYEIDTLSGDVIRTVIVDNASNVDWEDICFDDNYIFIGDIGNNSGSRTNLKVYRVLLDDYFNTINDTVSSSIIRLAYADQTDFSPSSYSTNFDAEALISLDDSLYIFTKNWGDNHTNIYSLSKEPGDYEIHKVDSLNPEGLITGAVYNKLSNEIILTGYSYYIPFVVRLFDFESDNFSEGGMEKTNIQTYGSTQVESVAVFDENTYYSTSEESASGNSMLLRIEVIDNTLGFDNINDKDCIIYPNPSVGIVNINADNFVDAEIYNAFGVLQLVSSNKQIDISKLSLHFCVIKINTLDGSVFRRVIKR